MTEAFPEFYGAAAQITVDQSQRHTIADITTPSGAQVSVVRKRIRLKKPGHDAMVADTLLAHSLWGQATAEGHVRFEMEAVAYGKALGVNINARRGIFFSDDDRQWIERRASELKASGLGPDHPRKYPPRSLVFIDAQVR